MEVFELPELIELNDVGGDFQKYLEEVYEIFKNDFVNDKPVFRGQRLRLKRHPLIDGREYTFYHMTHSGDIESERNPDLRRMERIGWPRPIIDSSDHPTLKVWRNIRRGQGGTKNRILLFHEEENYLVVLDDRGKYILPWTAYLVERNHKKRKLLKEWAHYNDRSR